MRRIKLTSVFVEHRSLMPRGSKLSVTTQVPGMDQDSISKKEYIARSEWRES